MEKANFLNLLNQENELALIGPLFDPLKSSIPKGLPLILVDGGADQISTDSESSTFSVGDGDSTKTTMDFPLDPDKKFSDLSFALSLIPQNIESIWLEGFLGGRRDHEYINLGELHHFLKSRVSASRCQLGSSILGFSAGEIEVSIEGSFSLLTLEKAQIGHIIGNCRYQLTGPTTLLPLSSHTLSNWGNGVVHIKSDQPFFIFLNPELEAT